MRGAVVRVGRSSAVENGATHAEDFVGLSGVIDCTALGVQAHPMGRGPDCALPTGLLIRRTGYGAVLPPDRIPGRRHGEKTRSRNPKTEVTQMSDVSEHVR